MFKTIRRQIFYFNLGFRNHCILFQVTRRQYKAYVSPKNLSATRGSIFSTRGPQPWNESPIAGHRQPRAVLGDLNLLDLRAVSQCQVIEQRGLWSW